MVATGVSDGWTYRKWKSGIAECTRAFEVSTSVQTSIDGNSLYQNSTGINKINYPFTFKSVPSEVASIQSPGGQVWLATSKGLNTTEHSAIYSIISVDKLTNTATYRISLRVEGFWK